MNVLVNTSAFDADIILTALRSYSKIIGPDVDVLNLIGRYEAIVEQTRD